MHHTEHRHLPGLGRSWLTPLYDLVQRLLGVASVHRRLLAHVDLRPGQRVLEIGCGTGNLTLLAIRRRPDATVVGLDPDEPSLTRARRKARRKGLDVRFDRGFAQQLPYDDDSFDVVLSSLMLHHLEPEDRPQALREVRRVLAPGGALHLVDFGGVPDARDGVMARMARRSHRLQDTVQGRLPGLLRDAGLIDVQEEPHDVGGVLGRLTAYRAVVPPGTAADRSETVGGATS